MKKTMFKRTACIALAAAMCVSMSACGGKGDAKVPLASKENVYKVENIKINATLQNIQFVQSDGEVVYLGGSNYDGKELENGEYWYENETKLVTMSLSGDVIAEKTLFSQSSDDNKGKDVQESKYMNFGVMDSSGSLWISVNSNAWNNVTGEEVYQENSLVMYDKNLEQVKEIKLDDIKTKAGLEYFWINNLTTDKDGYIYINANNVIVVLDPNGQFVYKIGEENNGRGGSNSGSWVQGIIKTRDGKVRVVESKWSNENNTYKSSTSLKEIVPANKGYGEEIETDKSFGSIYDGNDKYDIIVNMGNTMRGYTLETDEYETIIDWLASGFDTTTLQSPLVLPDGRIICVTYEYTRLESGGMTWGGPDSPMNLSILTKIPPEEVPDRKVIKFAGFYLPEELRLRILEFNRNELEYQVEAINYAEEGDWQDAMTRLNNDLIAGNIPDVLLLNSGNMPKQSYIAKGMFADIDKLIKDDPDLNIDDYVQNVFDLYRTNGKLYSIVPSFSVQTLVGKTSILGDKTGWTMAEFIAFADAHPDKEVMENMTKAGFLSTALYSSMSSYVNAETGECRFNSQDFIDLLEYANRFPTEIDWEARNRDPNYWEKQQLAYRTGDVLLMQAYFYSFGSYKEYEQGTFGEPITFIGFPSEDGKSGASLYASTEMAIMAKGKNKAGAWKLCRYFLMEDYQNLTSFGFPVKTSALYEKMEKAKTKDPNITWEETIWIGNNVDPIIKEYNTDADNQKVMALISSVDSVSSWDEEFMKIITEETDTYFAGQKSAKEVADIIQNRISIYLAESR